MTRRFSTSHLSWSDRFALVDHYKPTDAQIMEAFKLSKEELATARQLRASGTFKPSKTLDVAGYKGIFDDVPQMAAAYSAPTAAIGGSKSSRTSHNLADSGAPESATKKVKVPQKRGRKGDKITSALLAATSTPVPVDEFIKQHGVSLAVLRQSKRFVEKMAAELQVKIGKVVVKQDKTTKRLMIWKADSEQ